MLKEPKKTICQPIKVVDFSYSSSTKNGYLSDEERTAYKPHLKEYLERCGFQIDNKGIPNYPFPEHHNNGDKNPSAKVKNKTSLILQKDLTAMISKEGLPM
jgi:hypothetical protein